jgi:DNA-binding transcriptional regulator YhcF (GntR family)
MKKLNLIDLIKVDAYSITSKYLQIVNSVIREIQNGNFNIDDPMPSINELSIELDIARDTVERGYKHLKNLGVIHAVPRRGYFIKTNKFTQALKIFLLFNKLSAHKKTVYDSFISSIGEHAIIDFYIYNNDFLLFKKLLSMRKDDYTNYVIIPHFLEGVENAYEIINTLPKDKLLLLDKMVPGVSGEYAAAYENFEEDIYNALHEAMDALSKYHTLKIIFPKDSYYPPEIVKGFTNFCLDFAFNYKILSDMVEETISEGSVYLVVMEDDLVNLIEKIMLTDFKIGEQVGIISYNETPIKKIILNGITTISTDFHQMGVMAAELIKNNSKEHIHVPFKLTLRDSL